MVADDENKVTILELKTLKIVGGWMMQRKVLCSAGSNTQVILATSNCIGFWRWNSEKFFNIDL